MLLAFYRDSTKVQVDHNFSYIRLDRCRRHRLLRRRNNRSYYRFNWRFTYFKHSFWNVYSYLFIRYQPKPVITGELPNGIMPLPFAFLQALCLAPSVVPVNFAITPLLGGALQFAFAAAHDTLL